MSEQPPASGDVDLAEWLRDERLRGCPHTFLDQCCSPCLRDRLLASDWLAAYVQAARDEERARVLGEVERSIESARNAHWQQHLHDHPYADGKSCPRDYGIHDAFASAANIVREARGGAR